MADPHRNEAIEPIVFRRRGLEEWRNTKIVGRRVHGLAAVDPRDLARQTTRLKHLGSDGISPWTGGPVGMAQLMMRAPALEEVLTTLLDSAIQLTNAERGLLFLKEGDGELELRLARGKGGIYLSPDVSDYSRTVVKRVAATGREEVILED